MKPVFASMFVAAVTAVPLSAGEEPLHAMASLLPQAFVVQRVGGDRVSVSVLVEHGQEPHSFRPSAKKVTEVAESAVFFTSGMPFEEHLVGKLRSDRGQGPRVVSLGVEALGAEGLASPCEVHDHEHEHDHGEWDPHVWLSPLLVGKQAHLVAHALGELDPGRAAEFKTRAEALEVEALELDAELTGKLAPLKGTAFYVFHPAFGYFAKAYGLEQVAIETGGREPSAKHLSDLIERAQRDGAKLVLAQPQHQPRGAERVAKAIGGEVVELDPLAKDVFATMRTLADLLLKARQ